MYFLIKCQKLDHFREVLKENIKHNESINSTDYKLLGFLGKNNLTQSFVFYLNLFSKVPQYIVLDLINDFIKNKSGINCILFLENQIQNLKINKLEDNIISAKFLTNNDLVIQHQDIIYDYQKYKFIEETNNEECPVCKTEKTNLKLDCQHYYCSKCLYQIIYSFDTEKCCGICRKKFM